MDVLIEMAITRIHVIAAMASIVVTATATTAASFPNVAVYATFLSPSEQMGSDTTPDATTTLPETAGAGQQ